MDSFVLKILIIQYQQYAENRWYESNGSISLTRTASTQTRNVKALKEHHIAQIGKRNTGLFPCKTENGAKDKITYFTRDTFGFLKTSIDLCENQIVVLSAESSGSLSCLFMVLRKFEITYFQLK